MVNHTQDIDPDNQNLDIAASYGVFVCEARCLNTNESGLMKISISHADADIRTYEMPDFFYLFSIFSALSNVFCERAFAKQLVFAHPFFVRTCLIKVD